ncbi:hypothetical protein ACOSZC_16480 [Marinobacter salsuginis]
MAKLRTMMLVANMLMVASGSSAALRVIVSSDMAHLVDVEDSKLVGTIGSLYQCVFDHAEEEVVFTRAPLKRGLLEIRKHRADILIPLARSASRDEFAEFGGALLGADYVFVSKNRLPDNYEKLGLTYGIPREFVGKDLIADPDAVIEEVSDWSQLPPLLQKSRIDVIVVPTLIAPKVLAGLEKNLFMKYAGTIPASLYMSSTLEQELQARIRESVQSCSIEK